MKMLLLTGLPVAGTVIILVFGCLCRKTNSRGREDTRSGTEKQCSHNLFHTPLGSDMSSVYISAVVCQKYNSKTNSLNVWSLHQPPIITPPSLSPTAKIFCSVLPSASPLPPLNKTVLQTNLPTGKFIRNFCSYRDLHGWWQFFCKEFLSSKKWTRHLCTFMFNFLLLFQFHIIRFSCLDVFPVSKCENLSSKHPILLRPWEHYAFLFRIIHHESQLGLHKVWICQIWVVTCHHWLYKLCTCIFLLQYEYVLHQVACKEKDNDQ